MCFIHKSVFCKIKTPLLCLVILWCNHHTFPSSKINPPLTWTQRLLRLLHTSVWALNHDWLSSNAALRLVEGLRDRCGSRGSCASWSTGWLCRRLLHALHRHQDTGQLLQWHVAELRGKGTGWVFQTHQPAGITWNKGDTEKLNHTVLS